MLRLPFLTTWMLATVAVHNVSAADQPDILMIAVDDLRPMLGCYGDSRIKTPNIDRLPGEVFSSNGRIVSTQMRNLRLSLMTGLRPDSIGVFSNRLQDVQAFRKRRPEAVPLSDGSNSTGTRLAALAKSTTMAGTLMQTGPNPLRPVVPAKCWSCR